MARTRRSAVEKKSARLTDDERIAQLREEVKGFDKRKQAALNAAERLSALPEELQDESTLDGIRSNEREADLFESFIKTNEAKLQELRGEAKE